MLLISGRYDEATPATVQPYADRIKDVRWEIFENSSHMPHVEETERCLEAGGRLPRPERRDAADSAKPTEHESKQE